MTSPRAANPGRRPAGLLVPAALAALLLGAACAGGSDGDHQATSDEERVPVVVDDPFAQADMAELSQASDLVVRGTVVEAESGLRIGVDRRMRYTAFTVEVDEALTGSPGERVQVLLSSHVGRNEIAMEGRPLPRVGDQGVWFLTPVAAEFDFDGYVLTGQTGLLLLDGDEVAGGGVPGESAVAAEVQQLGSADAVVDHVRDVAG